MLSRKSDILTESSNIIDELRLSISSPPDRKNLVVEIFFGEEQFAEISQETMTPMIEVYPRRSGEFWQFELEDLMELLVLGKSKLEGTKSSPLA